MGIQAVAPGIPMGAIVVVVGLLAAVVMFIGHYNLIEKVLTAIVVFMGVVFLVTALAPTPIGAPSSPACSRLSCPQITPLAL